MICEDDVPEYMHDKIPEYNKLKEAFPDHVVIMKFDKFWEFVGADAELMNREYNMPLMCRRRDPTRIAHTGFPEISFEKYTNKLTTSGHRYVTLV
tara:strand:- start:251 stop:535 length:285 start_codon:yes stop_codon:yes gene_type:complete